MSFAVRGPVLLSGLRAGFMNWKGETMFGKRMTAAITDFLLGIIPLFIVCSMILDNIAGKNTDPQILPAIAFQMVLSPLGIIQHIIEYPYSMGITLEQLSFSLFILFMSEVALYSAFDLSPMRKTIGKVLMHIEYEHDLTLWCALLRNAIKTLTRYLLGIPLIFILFSKKGQTLHDVIIHNSVINST